MKNARCIAVFLCILLPLAGSSSDTVMIGGWLATHPMEVNLPAFHDTPNTQGNTFTNRQLLTFDHVDLKGYLPEEGKTMQWFDGNATRWTAQRADAEGYVTIAENGVSEDLQVAYLAAYVRTDRWIEAQLEMKSPYMFEAWLNGEKIGTKSTVEAPENGDGTVPEEEDEAEAPGNGNGNARGTYGHVGHTLELPGGTHLLVIKAMHTGEPGHPWEFMVRIKVDEPFDATNILPVTTPETTKDIHHFMDGVKISGVYPSADGSLYSVSYRQSLPPADRTERWTNVYRFSDNGLVHSFRHAGISRFGWLPGSNAVTFTTVRDGKTTIHYHDMESGEQRILLAGVEHFAGKRWSPCETYLIYTIREEGSSTDEPMRHLLGMQDRQAHFRHRSFLYKLDAASGTRTRLTHGRLTTSLHDISPDGKKMVFGQSHPDYAERPFYKHYLHVMDMQTLQTDTLLAGQRWGVSTRFSPDGQYLLATGGPSAFDRAGENIPEGMIANNYDTQAFIFSLGDRTADPITYDFDPSVVSAHWHPADNHIYLLTEDKDFRKLYRYNPRNGEFRDIDTGVCHMSLVAFAANAPVATYIGNQTNGHPRAYALSLRNNHFEVLLDTDAERYRHVVYGDVHDWDFVASSGVTISGRYYLPPGFDPETKYPVIVYQYGGTNPVGRSFGGRYPFNLWAGKGYIVYVMQPSGATGFGQEFSAAHVNNWGKTVVDEIVEGTTQFLEAHPFADPDRAGIAGASYGGFMTMLVLSHTDLFATGISHAGISNIASYWGEGYWGYSYSAEASARSFPWDSPELYVGQSPLFRADRIDTPLLLLTGDSDTNVPPGESIQMYTALRLLERPVELILVKGENHHILTYNRRLEWHDAIMAWWEKHLKGQPEWWRHQFPEKNY